MSDRKKYRFPLELYPAVRIAILIITGILIAEFVQVRQSIALFIFFLLIGVQISAEWYARHKLKASWFPVLTIGYLILIVGLGYFRATTVNNELRQTPHESTFLKPFENEQLTWFGKVFESTINANGTASIWLDVDSIRIEDQIPVYRQSFKTQIRIFKADDTLTEIAHPGSYIRILAEPVEIPDRKNPHDFDVKSWLNSKGVYVQAIAQTNPVLLEVANWYNWGWWRNHLRKGIDRVFAPEQQALAKAIMIGYKAELDRDVRQSFSRAGLSHIMAVSGMHVGFVLFPLWLLIPMFWHTKSGRIAGLLIVTIVLFFYAGITGFTPSVQRASVFAFFVAFARLNKRRRDPINLTGLAAVLILLIDPRALFAIGFQMSFVAVITIFAMLPVIKQMFRPQIRYRFDSKILQLILISMCIQAALFPILIDYFNEFSLVGPILNTFAAPVTQIMFIWGFVCTAIGFIAPEIAIILNIPANYLTAFLEWLTTRMSSLTGSFMQLSLPSGWIYGVWLAFIGFLATSHISALRWKWLVLFLFMMCGWQITEIVDSLKNPAVKVTFFDVGQGDAVLIQTPGGKHILYDVGVMTPMSNSGDRVLIPHLKAEGINKLDAVFLSHPHADHIGGILSLIEHVKIDTIYDSGFEYHSAIFSGYRMAAKRKNIPVIEIGAGDMITIDPLTPIFVLAPHSSISTSNANEYSISIRLQYGHDTLLLTGDAEYKAEAFLSTSFGDFLNVDLLKAGHHGSRSSSHDYFLNQVKPQEVVVSNAIRNRYQHPHPEATSRLHKTGAKVRFTSLEGAVQYRMTGKGIEHINWRENE